MMNNETGSQNKNRASGCHQQDRRKQDLRPSSDPFLTIPERATPSPKGMANHEDIDRAVYNPVDPGNPYSEDG